MKNLNLTLVIILFLTINLEGQIEKPFTTGNLILGGSVRANGMKVEITDPSLVTDIHYSEKEFNSDMRVGIFVSNNIAAGVKANILLTRTKFESGSTSYFNDLLFEPFMRFYTPIGLFGEISYGFGNYKVGVSNATDNHELKINTWNLGLGYSLFISKSVAIEPMIAYEGRKNIQNENQLIHKFKGVNAQIGVHFYLNILNKTP